MDVVDHGILDRGMAAFTRVRKKYEVDLTESTASHPPQWSFGNLEPRPT